MLESIVFWLLPALPFPPLDSPIPGIRKDVFPTRSYRSVDIKKNERRWMRPNKTRMGSSERNERDEDVECIQYIEEVNEIKYYEKKTNKEEEKENRGE